MEIILAVRKPKVYGTDMTFKAYFAPTRHRISRKLGLASCASKKTH
jgi:hypothetical protein